MTGKPPASATAGPKLIVHLKGGLGNQMFQYAAGRALAMRSGRRLYLDTVTGFVRDKVFKRQYSLGGLPIVASEAGELDRMALWFERARKKILGEELSLVNERPWGTYLLETKKTCLSQVAKTQIRDSVWMEGAWQSEKYFEDYRSKIARELAPPTPRAPLFLEMADGIRSCHSVAVGVRLFEEVPGQSKEGVGGLTPLDFYREAASTLPATATKPVFFVFCTKQAAELDVLNLPGKVHCLTHDNGYRGECERLWLMSQCRDYIISNSSYYWWAAWLAEFERPETRIFASELFPNPDTVPSRWTTRADI